MYLWKKHMLTGIDDTTGTQKDGKYSTRLFWRGRKTLHVDERYSCWWVLTWSLLEWTEEQPLTQNTHWTHAVQLSKRFRWRQDFVKFTHLYKTGQNGKGDHLIVWRHFLKRVTLIQRSIMEYQYFIYCGCYTTFLYSVTCVHGNMPTLLQKVFS